MILHLVLKSGLGITFLSLQVICAKDITSFLFFTYYIHLLVIFHIYIPNLTCLIQDIYTKIHHLQLLIFYSVIRRTLDERSNSKYCTDINLKYYFLSLCLLYPLLFNFHIIHRILSVHSMN